MPPVRHRLLPALLVAGISLQLGGLILIPQPALALPPDSSATLNLTAFIAAEIPTSPAIIANLTEGSQLNNTNLVVRGTCTPYTLVRVFNNGSLAGSINCSSAGSFVLNITLVAGQNKLTALNYNSDDVPGPTSNPISVYFGDPSKLAAAGTPEEPQIAIPQTPTETPNLATQDYQRLFEGTFIEPLAKALGLDPIVITSSAPTQIASIAANAVFAISIILLALLILL